MLPVAHDDSTTLLGIYPYAMGRLLQVFMRTHSRHYPPSEHHPTAAF